jgi:hypothetical protein
MDLFPADLAHLGEHAAKLAAFEFGGIDVG